MTELVLLLLALAAGDKGPPELVRYREPPKNVDAADYTMFGSSWQMQLVHRGIARDVAVSFGRPGIASDLGIAVVATGEGRILGLRVDDGKVLWERQENVVFAGAVSIVSGTEGRGPWAVIGSEDGAMRALRVRDGEPVWRAELGGISRAPVTEVGATLLVTTLANRVARIETATGQILWVKGRTRPSGLTVNGHGRATVDGGRVYVGFSDGYLEAYDLESGASVWGRQLSTRTTDSFTDVDADPVIAGGRLFAASYADGLYALDPATGNVLWRRRASAVTSLLADGELLVAASADGFVWGLRQSDGRGEFRTKMPPGPVSRMLLRDGVVMLGAGDSGVLLLNATNGQPVQATPLGSRIGGDPLWVGDDLLVLSESGDLYAMRWLASASRP